jgi:hypothetical protein
MAPARRERPGAQSVRRSRAQRDERVHGRRAMSSVDPRRVEEASAGIEDDRQREGSENDIQPERTVVDGHRDHDDRQRKGD